MLIVSITEAKARFFAIVKQVIAGEDVIIERMGKPVARISRYEHSEAKPRLGLMEGQARIPEKSAYDLLGCVTYKGPKKSLKQMKNPR